MIGIKVLVGDGHGIGPGGARSFSVEALSVGSPPPLGSDHPETRDMVR